MNSTKINKYFKTFAIQFSLLIIISGELMSSTYQNIIQKL